LAGSEVLAAGALAVSFDLAGAWARVSVPVITEMDRPSSKEQIKLDLIGNDHLSSINAADFCGKFSDRTDPAYGFTTNFRTGWLLSSGTLKRLSSVRKRTNLASSHVDSDWSDWMMFFLVVYARDRFGL
jgi:hypothetical protein